MTETQYLVVFALDQHRYALRLSVVQRVVQAVEITPLLQAPAIVLGVINVQGQVLPVVNLRQRFGLPEVAMDVDDHIIIAHTTKQQLGLVVSRVTDILAFPEAALITSERILPNLAYIEGVIKLAGEIILIHNLDTFLSLEEVNALQAAWQEPNDETHF